MIEDHNRASAEVASGERGTSGLRRYAAALILVVGLGIQFAYVVDHDLRRVVRQTLAMGWGSAQERSARLAFGADFRDYIVFLEESLPEDALVVIPPVEHDPVFGNMGLMQYLLFPRQLTNCPSLEEWPACRERYEGEDTYVIAVDGFPSVEDAPEAKAYLAFDESRGVFIPAGGSPP